MYPPSNNCSNYSPTFHIPSPCIQYEHELLLQYFLQEQPQPLLEDEILDILLAQTTQTPYNQLNCTTDQQENEQGKKAVDEMNVMTKKIPRNYKRSSNKDRHSKINTLRGPRDRRMRLSLDAARKFFDLQDMLGFDKASKTVEWLLINSKSAIEELGQGNTALIAQLSKQSCTSTTTAATGTGTASSISECEVVSGTDESYTKGPGVSAKKKNKAARRSATFRQVTRESRKQARAKARERTQIKKSNQTEGFTTHQDKQLLGNRADACNLAVNNGNLNPFCTIFNFQQNSGISHEHQFRDMQLCGKLWEA